MKILNIESQKYVKGGAFKVKLAMVFVTVGTLIVGFVDGFLRPLKCKN